MRASRKGMLTKGEKALQGRGKKKGELEKYMVVKKVGNVEEKETKGMEGFKITAEQERVLRTKMLAEEEEDMLIRGYVD